MDSQHDGIEGHGEDSREKKAQLAMGQLSLQEQSLAFHDKPLPTNSQIVQHKLAEMKELLKNLNDNQTYERGMAHYNEVMRACLIWEEAAKVAHTMKIFGTNVSLYEYELKHNIKKIETSQFVILSKLLPFHEVPKLMNIEEIREVLNAEKMMNE